MRVSSWSYEPRHLTYPGHDEDREFYAALREYNTDRALTKLSRFILNRGLEADHYEEHGVALLMLRSAGLQPVSTRRLREYMDQYLVAADIGISNNCFAIADDSCRAGRASRQLSSDAVDQNFIGWANHCISYDNRPDGTAVGYDLTAGRNLLGKDGEEFHVLGLHTVDLCELQCATSRLYGGAWKIFDDGKQR